MSLPARELLPAPEADSEPTAAALAHSTPSRLSQLAPWIAALCALAAGVWVIDGMPIGGFYDDAFYVILGKALATGQGYRNLNLPGAPFATHYPPGYPAFLALLWRIAPDFPDNVLLFKAANAVFLAIAAACAVRLGRERLQLASGVAVAAVIAGTITIPALHLSSMLISEPMFLALVVPILLWSERGVERNDGSARTAIALGAAAGVATLVRSHGIALVAAIVVAYAMRRRWRESGATLGAATLVMAPWLIWTAMHETAVPALMRGDYGSYLGWFVQGIHERGLGLVARTVARNLPDIVDAYSQPLQPPTSGVAGPLFTLCALVLAAAGCMRLARRARVTLVFIAGYLAIALVWPFGPSRFVAGIWVLLMLLAAAGGELLLSTVPPDSRRRPGRVRMRRSLGVAASSLVVIGVVSHNVRGYQGHWWAVSQTLGARHLVPKLAWIDVNALGSEVLATEHDEGALYLYSGRRAVPVTTFTAAEYVYPRTPAQDSSTLASLVRQYGARHVLVSSMRMRIAAAKAGATGAPLLHRTDGAGPWLFEFRR